MMNRSMAGATLLGQHFLYRRRGAGQFNSCRCPVFRHHNGGIGHIADIAGSQSPSLVLKPAGGSPELIEIAAHQQRLDLRQHVGRDLAPLRV
jgi:hypothetical protein